MRLTEKTSDERSLSWSRAPDTGAAPLRQGARGGRVPVKTESASKDARLAAVLDAYLAALEAGKAPDRDALLASHPDLAEALTMALRGLDFVHHTAKTLETVPQTLSEPKVLGDYRLLREVGRGGMAVVYEAEQISL